ncbi:CHAP domain-containing protein [Kitasatospora sp. NPDC089509]|uniref:CHAP domain-containing protein n=1 Tax=Kitasatospora sp. NPDC089509 TaxID=3364079 RepID=UPI0037F2928F
MPARQTRRTVSAALAVAALTSTVLLGATGTASASVGSTIIGIAAANLGNSGSGQNSAGGYGYYNSASESWCADFAKWVWAQDGVNVNGLTSGAASFAQYNGGLTGTPHVGDAVVFNYNGSDWAEHVALVASINSDGTIGTIGGNQSGHVTRGLITASGYYNNQRVSGYVSPIGGRDNTPAPKNTVHLEIIGSDGAMYNNDGNYTTGSWSSWAKMDSSNLKSLASVAIGNTSHVFAVAADGRVYTRDANYSAGTWTAWSEVPGGAGGAKAVTASATGNTVHLEIIGSDGAMYNNDGNYSAGSWSTWTKMDNSNLKSVSAVGIGNVNHVFAVAADGRVYTRDADYSAGTWTAWSEVPGGAGGAKAVTANATGNTVHLEIIGSDGAMYNNDGNYSNGSWTAWTKMDSANLTSITSASTGTTSHYFAVAADGHVYTRDADYYAGTWSNWAEVPGGAGSAQGVTATITS